MRTRFSRMAAPALTASQRRRCHSCPLPSPRGFVVTSQPHAKRSGRGVIASFPRPVRPERQGGQVGGVEQVRPRVALGLGAADTDGRGDLVAGDDLEIGRLAGLLEAKMKDLGDTFEKCSWYRDYWTDEKRNVIASARWKF